MTLDDVVKWLETATDDELVKVADELIDRDFAANPEHVCDGSCIGPDICDECEEIDHSLLDDASARLRRHEYREALHLLTIALGRDFDPLEKLPLVSP